jgi:hypothetical protein
MNRAQLDDAAVRVDALMVDGGGIPDGMRSRLADVDPAALTAQLTRRLRARGADADDARQQGVELAAAILERPTAVPPLEEPAAEPERRDIISAARHPAPRKACTCDHTLMVHKPKPKGGRGKCSASGCGCTEFVPAAAVAA